jgi:arachidonate 15-lipoxygenase
MIPLAQAEAGLPIGNIPVCDPAAIPADEASASRTNFYRLQVWLYKAFSPMQRGLPPIDADPQRALKSAYTWLHRTRFAAPVLPAEFLGSADLGSLAVRGPYACYTQRVADGLFEWDFSGLSAFAHHPGLVRLGARVMFEVDRRRRALRPIRIECALGTAAPDDAWWEQAKKLALCAATTHMTLVRHFNHVHLAGGAQLSAATRNTLPTDHPLYRLLWPYIYATEQSNMIVTRGQMLPGGDFETTFSFSFEGLCALYEATYPQYRFAVNDPPADAAARGVLGQGFETPTEDNLAELFGLMLDHARDYLAACWPDDAALLADAEIRRWVADLGQRLPDGIQLDATRFDRADLARLIARCIYLVSAQHEILGSFLWNYQLWTHRQPVRVRADGQREPLDVYQRLVNANYNLNVRRRKLIDDFSYLALDAAGAGAMARFQQALDALQQRMESEPWAVWRLYPAVLKVNINA